jgi:hypothetical protein
MATPPSDWTCIICYDPFPSSSKPCKIPYATDDDRYHYLACIPCLRTQFLSAQENEINYPIKWQKHTLHPKQFPGAFSQTFVRAYEAKEVEYKAPALERVYCECGTFVAPMVGEDARMSWKTLASSKLCPGCEARWCLRCAQRCGGFGVPHECVPERRLGERRLALGGLKKGKDFQICPGEGCGRTIQLAEACNAMTCQCGTSFCYICGEPAEPESEHWMRADGGCPRYGIAGSGRAMFDDDFGDADDEANAEAAFVLEEREVWERGEGESRTFDFIRWAWQATMAEDTAYVAQLDVMFGDPENEAQSVDEVHRAMEMYHPVSHSGVSEEQWQELARQHTNAVRDWLSGLQRFVTSGQGTTTDHLGGSLLDYPPDHVFNMAIAGGREAAAVWVEYANATVTEWTVENDVELPDSAVFDVGPGGAPGESWRIRDMDIFDDVPALGLFKLAGGALLVIPRPWQVVARFLEGGLFGLPAIDEEETTEREDETAENENAEDGTADDEWQVAVRRLQGGLFGMSAIDEEQAAVDDANGDDIAEEETAGDDPTEAETCEDEAARDDITEAETAKDEAAENEITKLDPHPVDFHIAAGQQMARVHADVLNPGENGVDARNLLEPWWYSLDVVVMRVMIVLVFWMLVYSCFMDWQMVVRDQ